jgi:hypothetical protein
LFAVYAATVLELRGKWVIVKLPEPKYWRVPHFAH